MKLHMILIIASVIALQWFDVGAEDSLPYKIIEEKGKIPILTPGLSERKTLKIELKNGLQAYLVSDPKTDYSSAVLTVDAGSWSDPDQYPGMAHFVEHMLFLGTKKFPKESEYLDYISENGGSANAFTTDGFTAYLFSIDNNAFPEAIDRFSNFFKEPLFNPSGVSRELRAIDQEYGKSLDNDDFRQLHVIKELSNSEHPAHRFTIGNSKTLENISQKTLIDWYQKHYSSNLMRLVVYSSLPLQELEELVVSDFQDIPNNHLQKDIYRETVSSKELEAKIVFIEPVKNVRSLTLIWNLPEQFTKMIDSKPDSLICYVLGHEGKESLLADLKRENLAEALSCGASRVTSNNLTFYIDIDLTELGVQQYDKVLSKLFSLIGLLKETGIPEYLYNEVREMQAIKYEYQPRKDAFSKAMEYGLLLPFEDMSTYPESSNVVQTYNPQNIKELIDYLTPQNAQFYLIAPNNLLPGVKWDKKEKWMNVSYTLRDIGRDKIKAWGDSKGKNSVATLPTPNIFIPKHLKVVLPENNKGDISALIPHPEILVENEFSKIYFLHDNTYNVPEIFYSFEIKTPEIEVGKAVKTVLGELWTKALEESLSEFTYLTTLAGLNYKVDTTDNGISIKIEGYSENAGLLFDEILNHVNHLTVTENDFNKYKQILLRDYQNFEKNNPLKQTAELIKYTFYKSYTTHKQKAIAIRKITYDKFQNFIKNIFKERYFEGILYGNLTKDQATNLTKRLFSQIDTKTYKKSEQPKTQVAVLPKDKTPVYYEASTKAQGNAIVLGIEGDGFSFQKRAVQQILMQAIGQSFFSELRTKQQTGYIVYSSGEEWERELINFFGVQSNTHDPRELLARFELFIENYLQELEKTEITDERFNIIKKSLINALEQPQASIKELGHLLNTLAFDYYGDFDWLSKRINGLKELTYSDFLIHSRQLLGKDNKRRFAVLMDGEIPDNYKFKYAELENLTQLKKMSLYKSSKN